MMWRMTHNGWCILRLLAQVLLCYGSDVLKVKYDAKAVKNTNGVYTLLAAVYFIPVSTFSNIKLNSVGFSIIG